MLADIIKRVPSFRYEAISPVATLKQQGRRPLSSEMRRRCVPRVSPERKIPQVCPVHDDFI